MTEKTTPPVAATLGLILCRLVIPAWIIVGATFKLVEATPKLLPRQILLDADRLGIDLNVLLAVLVSLEYLAAVGMILVGRLSRPASAFMMAAFCAILIREIAAGSSHCGCLGAFSPSPWMMLAIDGTLLLGVVLFRPRPLPGIDAARWPAVVAAVAILATTGTSFGLLVPWGRAAVVTPVSTGEGTGGDTGDAAVIKPTPLPDYWLSSDLDSWRGRRWNEIELFGFMEQAPKDIETGTRYVVFYNRTCDHCEDMFNEDLAPDPVLAARVTAVEVPADKNRLTSPDAWPMPPTACESLSLPLGVDWIITTPLAIRIVDGVIECAEEGGHKSCLGLE